MDANTERYVVLCACTQICFVLHLQLEKQRTEKTKGENINKNKGQVTKKIGVELIFCNLSSKHIVSQI